MTSRPSLRRGDIVLVQFPFTDLSGTKLRPALIVGHVTGDDLVLAFITSRSTPGGGPADCALSASDAAFPGTGLKVTSVVRLDKLATLHRNLVRRRLGAIGPVMQQCVDDPLRHVLGL
jgi:mRNA interferase MazF